MAETPDPAAVEREAVLAYLRKRALTARTFAIAAAFDVAVEDIERLDHLKDRPDAS